MAMHTARMLYVRRRSLIITGMEVPAQRSGAMHCTCTQYEQSMYYNYTQHRVHRTSHGEQYIYCPPTLLSNMNGYAMSIVLFPVAIKFVSHIRIRATCYGYRVRRNVNRSSYDSHHMVWFKLILRPRVLAGKSRAWQ